jgi:hypothetical protein
VLGGAAISEEFHPGFRSSTASYTVSLLNPKVLRDLPLAEHGLKILERPMQNFLPMPDGHALTAGPDSARTLESVRSFSQRDIHELFTRSAADLLDHCSRATRSRLCMAVNGKSGVWGHAVGGMGAITQAMAAKAAIAANLGPKPLYLKLLADADLPAEFRARIERLWVGSGTFRMNVALSELPKFSAAPRNDDRAHRRNADSFDYRYDIGAKGGSRRLAVLSAFSLQPAGRSRLASGTPTCCRPHLCDSRFVHAQLSRKRGALLRLEPD